MPPTLKEFREQTIQSAVLPPLPARVLDAADVRWMKLTGSEEWDSYLRHCQAKLDEAEQSCETWGKRALVATKDEDIREAQYCYHACNARVSTIKELMQLPSQVLGQEHTS